MVSHSDITTITKARRVVVCVGSGGVGKTTTAAAIALREASAGKRVLCLTIDPAKRLANSLGLATFEKEAQLVPDSLFRDQGLECRGALYAMMLDTKTTFDDLVRQYASSDEKAERILANRLYQYISTSLAGTQEYMAMEKLHAVRQQNDFDLIVLDTPPTANALDFLNAPERLIGAIDSPAMRWFIQAFQGAQSAPLKIVGRGAALLLRGLSKFTGVEFLERVAEFVTDINDLFGGFRKRAELVASSLRSGDVGFLIVTSPEPLAVDESLFLRDRLRESRMNLDAVVVNGVHPFSAHESFDAGRLAAHIERLGAENPFAVATAMLRARQDETLVGELDEHEIERLRGSISRDVPLFSVPAFELDIHDLRALFELSKYLDSTPRKELA